MSPSNSQHESVANRAKLPSVPHGSGSAGRWWLAVVVGSGVSLPLSWLLSYAAAIPFMIGTFFFALLGLIIGAVTFRVSGQGLRYSRGAVLIGTTIIVLVGWGYSIHVEASDFPTAMAETALLGTRDLSGQSPEDFKAAVEANVRSYVRDRYPPGGSLGYLRWVTDTGQIARGEIAQVNRTLSVGQHGWVWVIRAALSLGLLAFGVASQTWGLRRDTDMGNTAALQQAR